MKTFEKFLFLFFLFHSVYIFSQFGQNKVNYKDFKWYFIQTAHFDIYFSQEGAKITEFSAKAAEDALKQIEKVLNYRINNRITIILYVSQNDFQETNVTDEYLSEGIGGFTELFKNRVVLPFTGNYKSFRHVIHHELVHAVINDLFYGGSLQNVISSNITIRLPLWFNEGLAEYISLGWDTNTDMFIRDAATSEYLPDIQNLDGYFAYRGGQSVFNYIAKKYGEEKIGELVNKIKSKGSLEEGILASIGLKIEELNERWKKEIKREFWPDISYTNDPDEFSKRLTDHRKDGGFYNTSPAISPQGDKIAFITNRNFYFDVYLMNASDGKIIKRLIKGNRSADFEELNILTPGLSWSPDGSKIVISAKSNGYDVIYLIEIESENRTILPIRLDGISSVNWSSDGKSLVFSGQTANQTDIYYYNLQTNELKNLTNDIFSDSNPVWSFDGTKIFFASDRGENLNMSNISSEFRIDSYNYSQTDLYYYDLKTFSIVRVTDLPNSDETYPVCSQDGNEILFISDLNGINNIYKKKVVIDSKDSVSEIKNQKEIPITNSLNGLYQISASKDGKKLVFSSMYQSAYNIFLMTNPFDTKLNVASLKPTLFISNLLNKKDSLRIRPESKTENKNETETTEFWTGIFIDSSKTNMDSAKKDFSNYVFGQNEYIKIDTVKKSESVFASNNLDSSGNYKVNKYKINFSPDLIYANAGYSTLYGLLGTTVISFSDVLGNHRIIGQTSLQIDLKNSDYGISYFYLPNRIDYGISAFHTARFFYLQRGLFANLFRFRNYGAVFSFSFPLNKFYRLDAGLSLLNVTSENLENSNEPSQKATFFIPSLSFVHDNTIFGYTAPIDGTRFRIEGYANPFIETSKFGFYSILTDYRTYARIGYDYSFAFRFSSGYSGGNNPQRFFLGGIENWINRQFATNEIPIDSPTDFAFLTAALPLRGYNYAEKIGTKFALLNAEFRFPFIRYLVTGGLPFLFQNILGAIYFDAGTAWNNNRELQLFTKNSDGNTISKDLLMGTGVGTRIFFLYFLLRFDVAWAYNVNSFSKPIFYFSLGADF